MTVPYFYKNSNSRFLSIEGEDSNEFLQNLITNDINQCSKDNFLYSCLLTPQGKFLSDFFIFKQDEKYLLETHSFFYEKLLKKLNLYKLRSKVHIKEVYNLHSYSVFGDLQKDQDTLIFNIDPRNTNIGFKLIQALDITQDDWESNIENYLDLVAVAIGADLVPLIGENRTLCYFGLKIINLSPTIGLKAIIRGINKPEITLSEVSFYIAPRINSAGRIKHGNNAVELLLEENFDNAISFSKEIDNFNLQRRGLDQLITSQALKQIESNEEQKDFTTVVFKKDWHKGVIGIVASRLIEKYYRPTLVFTKSNDVLAASARSVKGYDVYNAIESCKEHLIQFGGHKYAAGLTLKPENYLAFKASFEKHVKKTIKKEMLNRTITVEEKIQFSEITPKFFRILKQFAPFGPSNKQPVFWSDNLNDTGYCKTVGEEGKHLKLSLRQDNSDIFKAIAFGLGDKLSLVKNKAQFKAAFNIDENNWNGVKSVQLKLLDIKSND